MELAATGLYGSILGLWLFVLSVRVIQFRRQGDAADPELLQRAIRGHGNLIEYAPTFLVLLLVAELMGAGNIWLHCVGGVFTLGRLMHGVGFSFTRHNMPLRFGGTVLTFVGLLMAVGTVARRLF